MTEPPIGELVNRASEQISTLVRDELRLARAEMQEKARHAGVGAGLFGGAGLITAYAVGVLIAAAVAGIAEGLPVWLSALIVGVALLLIAGVTVLIGRAQLRRATPATPTQAIESLRSDLDAVRTAAGRSDLNAVRTADLNNARPSAAERTSV
jgi:hypothetical protein